MSGEQAQNAGLLQKHVHDTNTTVPWRDVQNVVSWSRGLYPRLQ